MKIFNVNLSIRPLERMKLFIQSFQPGNGFRELPVLVIIFVGGLPPRVTKFQTPRAFNKTQWMSVAIYPLKIWMFQEQFKLIPFENEGLIRVNLPILKS